MMGGLINSSTVKGDLWMIEAGGNMACYPIATTAEGPGPRVGHSSLLVGNAFIVYGGDTKIDESDVLDETLYLLNTCTCLILGRLQPRIFTDKNSHTTMVPCFACWATTIRSLWSHSEYFGFQNFHLWRSSRGVLYERPVRF